MAWTIDKDTRCAWNLENKVCETMLPIRIRDPRQYLDSGFVEVVAHWCGLGNFHGSVLAHAEQGLPSEKKRLYADHAVMIKPYRDPPVQGSHGVHLEQGPCAIGKRALREVEN
jgi:hypothetical protein